MRKIILTIVSLLALATAVTACEVPEDSGTLADRKADEKTSQADSSKPAKDKGPKETVAQANARESAAQYLDTAAFSRSGLIDQLKYEGFSVKDATYGVDAQKANWNNQAALSAQQYLDTSAFSRQGLIDQLMFEGFTQAQATYGVNQAGL